jgi:hypothetical protein
MAATDTAHLTGYDVIVVQESFSGSGAYLKPGASLALDTFPVPVVYNKTYAFAAGRALAAGSLGGGAETEGSAAVSYVYLRVEAANQSNDLFKGVTFVGDTVALFKTAANDAGKTLAPDRYKALNYCRNAVIVDTASGDTIATTLLAKPAIINPAHTNITISFNDIPAGTKIGSEILRSRMITLGMNFGAQCGAYGSNMTSAGLTIWRNAVYMAAGLAVPAEPVEFQKWKIGYFTNNKAMDASAASPLADPIITMLQTNNAQWDVVVNPIVLHSKADLGLSQYNAIVIQESISGSDTILSPIGSLALEKLPVPTVYDKNYAFKAKRAFDAGLTGTGAETGGLLKIKVDGDKQSNPLFTGIKFDADSTVALLKAGAADNGSHGDAKALNYANLVKLTDTTGTLLALPAGLSATAKANITVGTVSDIPAGDSIGSEKLQARLIVLGMNFGAQCRDRGTNITSAGLTLWRNAVHSALGLPIPTTAVPQLIPELKVTLVTGGKMDDIQKKFLQNNSLTVEQFITSRALGLITDSASLADTLAMLNAADLVIIGRGPASSGFQDSSSRARWNSLTAPVILVSQWVARNSRINWFPSGTSNQTNASGITVGIAKNTADPIFAYSTFDASNTSEWSYLADDYIAVTTPFNGDTVVYREGAPLVVRFWEDSAYYPGAKDTVRGPRTYFGFGNDANGPTNFFPLTKSAQAAYYGEIMRITGNTVIEPLYYVSEAASILSITNDQEAYMTPAAFDAAVLAYTILIPHDVTVDSVQFAATASPLATITGAGFVQLTSDSVVHRIFANAENTRKGDTYTFTIMKEKEVIPGFEELAEAGITMFPNPANDNLTIKGLQDKSSVRILNTIGQLVYSNLIEGSKAVINISSFDNGVYILQIDMNGKIITTKFIKQ